MKRISAQDIVTSVADGLQYISYYHPPDFIRALHEAYLREESPAARDAIAQILINSRMSAEGHRPVCQDTGIVTAFVRVGRDARWDADASLEDLINQGVHDAYTNPDNPLRASVVSDPDGARRNTGDNTPAVVHFELVPGDRIEFFLAAKGGGSENKARFAILNPSDSVVDWVLSQVPAMGAGWCPPGLLGIGIGGTAEKAMLLAKQSLLAPIDIQALRERGPASRAEELRLELYDKVNALGIGAQGLGGLTTVLDVKVLDYPTHAASKPVAVIPNCAATRHIHFTLDGSGPARLEPPSLDTWPKIDWDPTRGSRRVDLDEVTREAVAEWQPGETLLLSGRLLTGRDAAHKRLVELIERGEPLPEGVDLRNRFIYYVGPVDPVGDEVVGPAGPTTATRMDKFTEPLLAHTGLLGMIGKAERGPQAIEAIRRHGAVYLIATGGAAYLVAKSIRAARVVAFEDLGMEAIYEFEVRDMPVTVAVDSRGRSIHETGPREWRNRIAGIPVSTA
ncbi:fumarate hydratase [Thiohalobacter sp.]|uniref:fumarate hydratase n=1 Tax=Thiohalobacter sp. TaxID=2025948 RepID=UPI002634E561|nr:fumarate hydratase [Thiohalobacter sp.]